MGRLKGSKNKEQNPVPKSSKLSPHDRITLMANLIIERILQDQQNNYQLLKTIQRS